MKQMKPKSTHRKYTDTNKFLSIPPHPSSRACRPFLRKEGVKNGKRKEGGLDGMKECVTFVIGT
jgi:hypothetical protein